RYVCALQLCATGEWEPRCHAPLTVSWTGFAPRVDRLRGMASQNRSSSIPCLKMFQTCGSATLSWSERTINAREGSNDHPSAALPLERMAVKGRKDGMKGV